LFCIEAKNAGSIAVKLQISPSLGQIAALSKRKDTIEAESPPDFLVNCGEPVNDTAFT
jgi:hypothetical protein